MNAWSGIVPRADVERRHQQVLALGAAYQVVSFVGIVRNLEPASAPQLSGGAVSFARLLEEAVTSARALAP